MPGFSKITRLALEIPKISEDVANNSEVLKERTMLHTELQKSEICGKYRHLLILYELFVSRIGLG